MNNKNQNMRILVAIVLSLLFLIPYMYFFSPQQHENHQNNATIKAESAPSFTPAPNATSAESAPIAQDSTPNPAPISQGKRVIAVVESDEIRIEIDELGRISNAILKAKKYLDDDNKPLSLLSKDAIKPLEVRFQDTRINQLAFNTAYTASESEIRIGDEAKTLTLSQNLGDFQITKTLTFYKNLQYDIAITLSRPATYFISNGTRPVADDTAYVFKGIIIKKADEKLEKIEDGDAVIGENLSFNNAHFIASVDRYYTTLFFTREGTNALNVITDTDKGENPIPYITFDNSATFSGYIGPKDYQALKSIAPTLTDAVEYGVITFFAKPIFLLLEFFYGVFSNWGWAIIALTLVVRVILYPLTYKGMVSMQKLKDLAPKLKEIQEKYKGDGQKLQLHMMELYKKHNVNPMGGCLPLLLQIPVFFAIYRVLYNAVELKDSAWLLWIQDLSAMDPYFILPILMGATMYLQQRLSPATFNDPMQEKVFKLLPLIFTIFLITFPAGLILYWTVNNIFSIIQQTLINKIMECKKAEEILEARGEK